MALWSGKRCLFLLHSPFVSPQCKASSADMDLQMLLHSFPLNSTSLGNCKQARLGIVCSLSGESDSRTVNRSKPSGTENLSYLSMWKRAVQKEKEEMLKKYEQENQKVEEAQSDGDTRKKQEENFFRLLEVSEEDRKKALSDRVIDRAGAALSAAQSFFSELNLQTEEQKENNPQTPNSSNRESSPARFFEIELPSVQRVTSPGPDFWTWEPPSREGSNSVLDRKIDSNSKPKSSPFKLKERSPFTTELPLPLQSQMEANSEDLKEENETIWNYFQQRASPSLPPLQSLSETDRRATLVDENTETVEKNFSMDEFNIISSVSEDLKLHDLHKSMHESDYASLEEANGFHRSDSGENEDGSRWWKEWGVEYRGEGEVCEWTVLRGVSYDGATEWQEKWWEIRKENEDYSELGAEKSGRDVYGKVWRETWKEAMWMEEERSLAHIEKSADKWGTDGTGGEWHEKWFEHYDAYGRANKWADKWSKINPHYIIDPGHAHVWHERWGEDYDGAGKVFKYTDKWAERYMGEGRWSKWGDKWNEEFEHGHGKKYGETWSEREGGERWNRQWGEEYDGLGGVHKYGHSSEGEHWDFNEGTSHHLYVSAKPHFGFRECFDHSARLRQVGKKWQKKKKSL